MRRAGPGAPPGARATGCGSAGSNREQDPHRAWLRQGTGEFRTALTGVTGLGRASPALAAALVRAGALGAAMRLAQRYAAACARREREPRAAVVLCTVKELLSAVGRHVPEVCAHPAASRLLLACRQRRRCAGLTPYGRCARLLRCWRTWSAAMGVPACALVALLCFHASMPFLPHTHALKDCTG